MKTAVKFLPLLFLYVSIVLMFSINDFQGDEASYAWYAQNLSHGYYCDANNVELWTPPGYPIALLPFAIFGAPWLAARLLNAIFLFGVVMYFYHALLFYMKNKKALCFSYLLGLYLPMVRHVHLLLPESLAFFLISGFLFYFCKLYNDVKNKRISFIFASGYLACLALTKALFGYVILIIIPLLLFLYGWKRRAVLKKALMVFLIAFLFCMPYLFYTYSLTGRVLYWKNRGSMSLYWLSSPYHNELGNWYHETYLEKIPSLAENHQDFFDKISDLNYIQKDDKLLRQAIKNIKGHPVKFIKNWTANIGRMLFSYPFSYTPQKLSTFFYIIPNMFIIVLSFLCIYPSYVRRRTMPCEISVLFLFAFIAFIRNSLFSAYSRHFSILVPIVALWMFFTITNILKIEIRR